MDFQRACIREMSSGKRPDVVAVAAGMRVEVDFVLSRFDDGTIVDALQGKGSLSFVCGADEAPAELDTGVRGMVEGERREISLKGETLYGARDEKKVDLVAIDQLPAGVKVGDKLQTQSDDPIPAVVIAVGEKSAAVDHNHPLAGVPLKMVVTLKRCETNVNPKNTLIVETVSEGDNKNYPSPRDWLTMHYTGWLAETGQKFDSSHDHGAPFRFQIGVGQVILGWDEGVMTLSLGERAKLRIPAAMGYGERGAGGVIPPNADLVFEVELLKIETMQNDESLSELSSKICNS